MSISQQFRAELERLASQGIVEGSATILLSDGGYDLHCAVLDIDSIGCRLERLTLKPENISNTAIERLRKMASELTKRLVYLLEPIAPVEFDREGASVQLRSKPPHKDDDGTQYYELVVNQRGLQLYRYSKAVGESRRVISSQLTREVLCRLIADFYAVACEWQPE